MLVPLPHGVVVPLRAIEIDGVVVVPVVTLIAGVVIRLFVARGIALLGLPFSLSDPQVMLVEFALLRDRSALLLNFVDTGAVAKFGVEK